MKKIQIMGWLVMAAAFITTFTACSSDENNDVIGGTPVEPVRSISVTVGAGIIDEAITRSEIDNSVAGKHTLKFTTGDKLFVRAMYIKNNVGSEGIYYPYMLRGFLTMVGSPTNDGKSASFMGELYQYNRGTTGNSDDGYNYTASGSIDGDFISSDPIGNAVEAFATLVHSGTDLDTDYTDDGWNIYYPPYALAEDVETLMTKYLTVTSPSEGYKSGTFTLNDVVNLPIIKCTIKGLTAGTTYAVTYVIDNDEIEISPAIIAVANGDDGEATFAFFGDEGSDSHVLRFSTTSETKKAILGNDKSLAGNTIYNVIRTASAE